MGRRKEEEMEHGARREGEATGLGRAEGGSAGGGGVRHVPLQVALPIRREGGSDGWKLKWELEYHHCTALDEACSLYTSTELEYIPRGLNGCMLLGFQDTCKFEMK